MASETPTLLCPLLTSLQGFPGAHDTSVRPSQPSVVSPAVPGPPHPALFLRAFLHCRPSTTLRMHWPEPLLSLPLPLQCPPTSLSLRMSSPPCGDIQHTVQHDLCLLCTPPAPCRCFKPQSVSPLSFLIVCALRIWYSL